MLPDHLHLHFKHDLGYPLVMPLIGSEAVYLLHTVDIELGMRCVCRELV